METLIEAVYVIGLLAAPVAGYLIAARRPDATRLDLLRGAVLGGLALDALMVALTVADYVAKIGEPMPVSLLAQLGLFSLVTCGGAGLVIGALGLAARALGAWLSRES